MLNEFIIVGIGGGLGAFLRAGFSDYMKKIWHRDYPMATFLINITGAFLLGLLYHYHSKDLWMLLLGTGALGGFTTFSTLNYELITLIKTGKGKIFLLYGIITVVFGVAAAALGVLL